MRPVYLFVLVLLTFSAIRCLAEDTKPAPPKTQDSPAPSKTDEKSATPPKGKTDTKPEKPAAQPSSGLLHLSIQELMNVQVYSVSKVPEKAAQAPAGIFVITQDDIRRSGATSIAEALRMAPGLDVARITKQQWAISSRGFNGLFANKLLVLMDGRTLYTPLFAGVRWDEQDTFLEDVDRIEVVRGPGATLWGSNAVNGVINIVSKSAKDTQGGYVTAGAGNEERGFGGVRYGAKPAKDIWIRGYVKYFDVDESPLPSHKSGADDGTMGRGGFRMDWDMSKEDRWTFQGDVYRGIEGQRTLTPQVTPPFSTLETNDLLLHGGNFLTRWNHTHSATSNSTLQMYYDRMVRSNGPLSESRDTVDLDFQHQFQPHDRHSVLAGIGYRLTRDRTNGSLPVQFDPDGRTLQLPSAFVQDTISILPNKLSLTVGSKFEVNDYTGFEVQPSLRILWNPHKLHTLWASVSRAVRAPSRTEDDIIFTPFVLPPGAAGPGSPATLVQNRGDKDVESETVIAYELGYRVQPHKNLSIDVTGFVNDYSRLITFEDEAPTASAAGLILPSRIDNKAYGTTYGGEAVLNWQPRKWWRLSGSYSHLTMQIHTLHSSNDATRSGIEGNSPRNQFQLHSRMDLPHRVELDLSMRYVERLPNLDIPSYVSMDARVGWHPLDRLELSLIGKDSIDNQHSEFDPIAGGIQRSDVQRSVFFKIGWKF